jgi:hypothetical protein
MRYDAYGIDGEPFPFACKVVAADGQILTPTRRCDTETGYAERYVIEGGLFVISPVDHKPITFHGHYPAPLSLVPAS